MILQQSQMKSLMMCSSPCLKHRGNRIGPLVRYGIDEFVDAAAEFEQQACNVTQIDEPTTLEEAVASEQLASRPV